MRVLRNHYFSGWWPVANLYETFDELKQWDENVVAEAYNTEDLLSVDDDVAETAQVLTYAEIPEKNWGDTVDAEEDDKEACTAEDEVPVKPSNKEV